MYCLLNEDEVVDALSKKLLRKLLVQKKPKWSSMRKLQMRYRRGLIDQHELNNQIELYVKRDLTKFIDLIEHRYKKWQRPLINHLRLNFDSLTNHAQNRNYIVNFYLKSDSTGFVKNFGPQIADKNTWIIKNDQYNKDKVILVRSVYNNENLIKYKLDNNSQFWFIDSGYTNFLYSKGKPWHRIVKNHIHHKPQDKFFPANRLNNLPSFPLPWRNSGEIVYVVEASNNHCALFNITLQDWKNKVSAQVQDYSNFKIEFRPKEMNKKLRSSVYQDLKDRDDIYCVITDSSAAAIEAIWLGIPIITLNRHITNTVSRSDIKDINDLYRGPIGNWLCELTYSQFTFEEICNGTAKEILKAYHDL